MDNVFVLERQHMIATLSGDPQNPPIFLLHGWTSHRHVWRQTVKALEAKYYCIAIDLLGFGASDKPADGDYSVHAQGLRIVKLADQMGFKRFSLIGHSLGGQIAMYIASALVPGRIDKLGVVAGVVTGRLSDGVENFNVRFVKIARKLPFLYGIARPFVNVRPFANWGFRSWFYDMNSLPFESWEVDRIAVCNQACAISADETGKAIHAVNLTKYIHRIKASTLIISGEEDGVVPVEQAYVAQSAIPDNPGNQLAIIKKCGHFPMYEKTNQYLKALGLLF